MTEAVRQNRLAEILRQAGPLAVAVSGGVDSMTLSAFAKRTVGTAASMIHAVSPAVPQAATKRVRQLANAEGWELRVLDAGEFEDETYLANPANRCFFCKTNLYGAIAKVASGVLMSGTNLDDLEDWRPGLAAAREHGVRHPFVEAGFSKADVRTLAAALDLGEIAELPASPCLSSRVETGLRIDPAMLALVDRVETHVRARFDIATVRCRIRPSGPELHIDPVFLEAASADTLENLRLETAKAAGRAIDIGPYVRGGAFLRVLA